MWKFLEVAWVPRVNSLSMLKIIVCTWIYCYYSRQKFSTTSNTCSLSLALFWFGFMAPPLHLLKESYHVLLFPVLPWREGSTQRLDKEIPLVWPTLGWMHQKTVGMFLAVLLLMMGIVESRELLNLFPEDGEVSSTKSNPRRKASYRYEEPRGGGFSIKRSWCFQEELQPVFAVTNSERGSVWRLSPRFIFHRGCILHNLLKLRFHCWDMYLQGLVKQSTSLKLQTATEDD